MMGSPPVQVPKENQLHPVASQLERGSCSGQRLSSPSSVLLHPSAKLPGPHH